MFIIFHKELALFLPLFYVLNHDKIKHLSVSTENLEAHVMLKEGG